jgi:hypothetical protein
MMEKMKLSKFKDFAGSSKNSTSTVQEELSNLDDEFEEDEPSVIHGEFDMDELLTSFCRDLYQAYLKATGREGRIITSFQEFYFYRLIFFNNGS